MKCLILLICSISLADSVTYGPKGAIYTQTYDKTLGITTTYAPHEQIYQTYDSPVEAQAPGRRQEERSEPSRESSGGSRSLMQGLRDSLYE